MRGGAALTVDVAFLPFAMGAHVAHLIFEDVDHGRFVVELLGKADLPPPAATVRAEIEVRPQTFDVAVDHSNPPFERARRLFLEKHPGRADRAEAMKARHALDAWPAAIEYAALSSDDGDGAFTVANPVHDRVAPELITLFATDAGGQVPGFIVSLMGEFYSPEDRRFDE